LFRLAVKNKKSLACPVFFVIISAFRYHETASLKIALVFQEIIIMTEQEMKELIDKVIVLQYEADSLYFKTPVRAQPNPPARPEDIKQLEEHLKDRDLILPPSYRQLLEIYNGIENFLQSDRLSLRSAKEIEESYEDDSDWEDFAPLGDFVFGSGDETVAFICFNPEVVDKNGEMEVVIVDESGDVAECENLEEFLRWQLTYHTDVVEGFNANRAHLKDD